MAQSHSYGKIVGWLHAERDVETYDTLQELGLEQYRGVHVVREGDEFIAWLIGDDGDWEPLPVNARGIPERLDITNRDRDYDAAQGMAWTQDDCYISSIDMPWEYDYEQAAKAGGQQLALVLRGLRSARTNRNPNPGKFFAAAFVVKVIEIMYFTGIPPEDAAELYYKEA